MPSGCPCHAHGIPTGCRWLCHGVSVTCPWDFHGRPIVCQCNTHGMRMGCRRDAIGWPYTKQRKRANAGCLRLILYVGYIARVHWTQLVCYTNVVRASIPLCVACCCRHCCSDLSRNNGCLVDVRRPRTWREIKQIRGWILCSDNMFTQQEVLGITTHITST